MSTQLSYTHQSSERLDKYVSQSFPEHSRSQWQQAIKQGAVTVNGTVVPTKYQLAAGDTISILESPTREYIKLPKIELGIVAETNDYIVVNKPAGIPVHPDDRYRENTLIQQVCRDFPDIAKLDPESERPGMVQRLDKDVSGCMIIARTADMLASLKQQFHDRSVYKEYIALVHDPLTKQSNEVTLNLERDKKTGKMLVRPSNQSGREAITYYEVIKNFEHFSLLKIIIKTGRTHQIRVTMRSLDHPIVGDTLYAKKKTKASLPLDRPFLHAHTVAFDELDGTRVTYSASLPQELQLVLDSLS